MHKLFEQINDWFNNIYLTCNNNSKKPRSMTPNAKRNIMESTVVLFSSYSVFMGNCIFQANGLLQVRLSDLLWEAERCRKKPWHTETQLKPKSTQRNSLMCNVFGLFVCLLCLFQGVLCLFPEKYLQDPSTHSKTPKCLSICRPSWSQRLALV